MESSQTIEETNSENILENSNNESISEQKEIENIASSFSELTPLIIVDKIERLYHTILNKVKYGSLHTLSSYKETHKIKFNLIDFKLATPNSSKILRKMANINCVKIYMEPKKHEKKVIPKENSQNTTQNGESIENTKKGESSENSEVNEEDKLFTGEKNGYVYMHNIKKGLEIESFGVPGLNSPVTTIENKANDYLLVGYENGTINLFDAKKISLIKSISDIHKTKIIALKFVSLEKNGFQVISSDDEGQVMLITSSNTMFNKKTTGLPIYKDNEPTYAITKFKPFQDKKLTFLVFASTNKVRVYTLEPKLESISEIKKPKCAEKNDIPDISLGWGVRPIKETVSLKKSTGIKRDIEILLAVGWGNIISLYGFLVKNDNYKLEGPIGFFQNNHAIIKLGFFSSSIIYYLDKSSQIKVINTAFCNYGKYDEDNKSLYHKNALIDKGDIFKNLKYNNASKTNEQEYYYYRNFIYNMRTCILLFSNEGLYYGKILNYKECIDNIINNGNNWNSAMCLALDIYKGNYNNFLDVPLDEKERKTKLFPYLKELLNKYIDYNFNVKNDSNFDNEIMSTATPDSNDTIDELKEEKIIECINVSIEFCIEINAVDFLLKDVELTFGNYGKGDLFYKLLEPFIFNDLLLQENIGNDALSSFYGSYKIKNELILLSHLFTHFNLKCLNNFFIKKLAVKDNLFNVIIYIFSNGDSGEDFFLPITKMYSAYSKEVKKENVNAKNEINVNDKNNENEYKYFSYYDLYIKKGIKGINEMEKCKEYIGHKLLWYIQMCLKGNKYASGIEVDLLKFQTSSENYKKFIAYIYFWILQEKIFESLLEFDSYSLFSVISLFFTEPKNIKILKSYDFSTINADLIQQLVDEQENNSYFVRAMTNSLNKVSTIVPENKKEEQQINDTLKSSLTIAPGKSNIDKNLKEEIKEHEEKSVKNEKDSEKNEKKIPKDNNEKKEKEKEDNFDPFATAKNGTKYGQGVKLNDLNSVLEYIIRIVESQPSELSHLDLEAFLIKYASKTGQTIPEKIRKKIVLSFKNLLIFFAQSKEKNIDLITRNQDKFNIHNFSKKVLESQDPYIINISSMLNDLLVNKPDFFNQTELYQLDLAATGTQFTRIKIKIGELRKLYKNCLEIYINQENQKVKENVFIWMEDKFKYFIEATNEEKNIKDNELEDKEKDNKINSLKKDFNEFINAIISKIYDLAKINKDKTLRIVGKYFSNTEKIKAYNKLSENPQIQFEFLEQLLYQPLDQMNEEANLNDNDDQQQNIDLFKLYMKNRKEKEKDAIREEKKIREEFDQLLLSQIHLLFVLKRKTEILPYLKKNIKNYPNYPMREALKECMENDITDASIFIFQTLGENRSALNLTKQNLQKAFEKYTEDNEENKKDFLKKLEVCTTICKENSESLLKKITTENESKQIYHEGEGLWFDLLQKLYEYQDEVEKNEKIDEKNKKSIQLTIQKGIEDLLKQMCLYVSIQNLVSEVTDKQERAQYKEFKTILESMLRSNTSFDRVLHSVMAILKDSIENSESKRKKVTAKGNNYNYKKCDVCNKIFENSRKEIVYFFGCGHQSHERCCHKKKINENKINKINIDDDEEDFIPECEVCRKNKIEIENKSKWDEEEENVKNVQNAIDDDMDKINISSPDKVKSFKFGNKKDKFKKIAKYDKHYQNEISMFY